LGDRAAGVIDELGLHALPALNVTVARRLRQRPDLKLLTALLARLQLRLSFPLRVGRANRALVFGAELLLQPARPPPRQRLPENHGEHSNDSDRD
jgi:hypothetical protein